MEWRVDWIRVKKIENPYFLSVIVPLWSLPNFFQIVLVATIIVTFNK